MTQGRASATSTVDSGASQGMYTGPLTPNAVRMLPGPDTHARHTHVSPRLTFLQSKARPPSQQAGCPTGLRQSGH